MTDIASVDKNFNFPTKIEKEDIKFYSVKDEPFKVYGIYYDNGRYRRLPEEVAKTVNSGVLHFHSNTAGGRLRFITNSPYVALHINVAKVGKNPHFALTGSTGCDLYVGNVYRGMFIPPFNTVDSYEGVLELGGDAEKEITINLPLYADITELYIGLKEDATLKEPTPYIDMKPIVYYGSSITQGACASRPGMSYSSIISRRFNCDYINLGFGGSAKAEDTIIDYINGLDMSIFVYDYDHNAPNAEYLKNTHEKMYRAIREKHPDLPIIMMSRPRYTLVGEDKKRREVVRESYNNAVAAGDKNVYFLDNEALTAMCGCEGIVDGTHPTDYGLASMAKAVGDVIETILEKMKA